MTPQPALASAPAFVQPSSVEDYDAPLPSFVGIGLGAFASGAELGALADRAEAGVSGLQLIFAAQAAGAIEMPAGLADQLRVLLARATGHVAQPRIMGGLSLVS
jgi:hypothetical protein